MNNKKLPDHFGAALRGEGISTDDVIGSPKIDLSAIGAAPHQRETVIFDGTPQLDLRRDAIGQPPNVMPFGIVRGMIGTLAEIAAITGKTGKKEQLPKDTPPITSFEGAAVKITMSPGTQNVDTVVIKTQDTAGNSQSVSMNTDQF